MEVGDDAFDVAVIGGGPGGSTLAALLASRGFRVALVDRDLFPRDKLCGEFLSYDALPLLDQLGVGDKIEQSGATHISTCRVVGTKRTYSFPLPVAARGISRLSLDEILLRQAERNGAHTLEGYTVDSIGFDGDQTTLAMRHRDGAQRSISARLVAGAWGRWGRLDRQLGRPFVEDHEHRHFGFKRHYVASQSDDRTTIDLY